MRFPYPARISYVYAFGFSSILALLLLAEGNSPSISILLFCIVMVASVGFNRAGGLRSTTGAYILFTTLFTALLGVIVKVVLGEPLQRNAENVEQTLSVYLVGSCMMSLSVFISERITRKRPILKDRLNTQNASRVVTGCFVAGVLLPFGLDLLFPAGAGGFGTIVAQLNIALPLCVSIGVFQKAQATHGGSTFTWPSFLAAGYGTYAGLIGFSKEGIFSGAAAWLIAAAAARARFSILKMAAIIVLSIYAVYILVPYAQYGRNFRLGYGGNYEKAQELLRHPLQTRELAYHSAAEIPLELYHWYDSDRGIFDRLTLVPIDSALIRHTDETGPIGFLNAGVYFANIIPHFLYPDKPEIRTGNQYAHEIGMLAPADLTTGISFSPFSEAYHLGGWIGVIFLVPLVLVIMFATLTSVVGTLDDSPWGLFFIIYFAHGAAEGSLQIPIRMASIGVEAILVCAFLMIYIAPLITSLVIGPGKHSRYSQAPVQPVPRRTILE